MQAAKDLLERVSRTKSKRAGVHLDKIVDGMRRFSLGCIQLANWPVEKKGIEEKERDRVVRRGGLNEGRGQTETGAKR